MSWTRTYVGLFLLWLLTFVALLALCSLSARRACAHDVWADGSAIPAWIKSACCGEADAHLLAPDDYWIDKDGFHIRAINRVVDIDKVQPSQDGQVWAFYKVVGTIPYVYCVFYPASI